MKKFVLSDNDPISGGYLWRIFFDTLALIFSFEGFYLFCFLKEFILFPFLKGCHRGGLLTADREA